MATSQNWEKKEDKIIAPNLLLDDICDKTLWTNQGTKC
jgi:hypothetical protein